jgi:NAD(P)-dependent dehydrogenase (short-subunit alcohol dehydrogenase family)
MDKKNILILGASGLIGYSLYKKFKLTGHNILLADLKNTKRISKNFYKADASNEGQLINLIKVIIKNHKKIDVVINSIYPTLAKKKINFFSQTKNDFLNKINSHLGINFLINKLFLKYFQKRGRGNIIHLSSIYGSFIPRFEIYKNTKLNMPVDYLIAKSSINYFTKYLAKLLLGSKITINNISPGGIKDSQNKKFIKSYSKFTNYKTMLNPNDIFDIINFLVSSDNLKITGQNIIVDDGFTL